MTKDEIQAMIDAAVTAARPQVYTSVEECPEWARETVQRAVDCGVLQGNQSGALHLTDEHLNGLMKPVSQGKILHMFLTAQLL